MLLTDLTLTRFSRLHTSSITCVVAAGLSGSARRNRRDPVMRANLADA